MFSVFYVVCCLVSFSEPRIADFSLSIRSKIFFMVLKMERMHLTSVNHTITHRYIQDLKNERKRKPKSKTGHPSRSIPLPLSIKLWQHLLQILDMFTPQIRLLDLPPPAPRTPPRRRDRGGRRRGRRSDGRASALRREAESVPG